MKYNRILSAALTCTAMASLLVGCYEDYDDYSVGAQNKSLHVAFVNDGELRVDKTATDFTLTLVRSTDPAEDHSALEVPIIVNGLGIDFKVPASATFAAGKDTTEIVVALSDTMKLNVPYYFNISLPEEYYATYDEYTDNAFMLTTTVTKEDYEKYADATLVDYFWDVTDAGPAERKVEIEYSPMLETYRVRSIFVEGYNFFYKWNETDNKVTVVNSSAKEASKWSTGLTYGSYGAITAYSTETVPTYDAETKTFEFEFEWKVSAGSFGSASICLVLAE